MAQKRNRHGNSANTEGPKIQKKKKKKSTAYTKKTNLFKHIIISNTENVNQISNGEEATQKFNLYRCQQKKKKKKKSVPPYQICKGKSIMEPSNDVNQVMGIHFPEEVTMDILSRLPVRSVLRFKCVSKFWKPLITNTYFKMKHYIHSKNDQNSQKFLIARRCVDKDDAYNFYTSSLSTVQMVEDEQKVDSPSSFEPKNITIYCSCDGLVLIFVSYTIVNRELLLWNPSTRESTLLPHPEFPLIYCVWGMAYDATSDDYKIVAVNLNADRCHNTSIEILALKSGSWRRIDYPTGIRRCLGYSDCGSDYLAFVHGAFHWLGEPLLGYYTIVSFNISNEVFGKVPLLTRMFAIRHRCDFIDRGVSVLRGMLCFYSTYSYATEGMKGTFRLWVMKEYGVRESWTNLIKIRDPNFLCSAKPKYMFEDGEVLLCCKRSNYIGSKFMTSRRSLGLWPQCSAVEQGIVYAESFISPKSLTC